MAGCFHTVENYLLKMLEAKIEIFRKLFEILKYVKYIDKGKGKIYFNCTVNKVT